VAESNANAGAAAGFSPRSRRVSPPGAATANRAKHAAAVLQDELGAPRTAHETADPESVLQRGRDAPRIPTGTGGSAPSSASPTGRSASTRTSAGAAPRSFAPNVSARQDAGEEGVHCGGKSPRRAPFLRVPVVLPGREADLETVRRAPVHPFVSCSQFISAPALWRRRFVSISSHFGCLVRHFCCNGDRDQTARRPRGRPGHRRDVRERVSAHLPRPGPGHVWSIGRRGRHRRGTDAIASVRRRRQCRRPAGSGSCRSYASRSFHRIAHAGGRAASITSQRRRRSIRKGGNDPSTVPPTHPADVVRSGTATSSRRRRL